MFRPNLKRPSASPLFRPKHNTMHQPVLQMEKNAEEDIGSRFTNMHQIIPGKLLDLPDNKDKQKNHLVAPLMVQSHKYPPKILQKLAKDSHDISRGIGSFRQVNWYFRGRQLSIWLTDKQYQEELEFQNQITSVSVCQLQACNIPAKIRNKYTLAVSVNKNVLIYSLNNFTLETFNTGIKYTLDYCLHIEKIKFADQNKLAMIGNTGAVQVVEIGSNEVKKNMDIPFYRKFMPISTDQSTQKVEQILYTPKRIFALVTELKKKGWFMNTFQNIFYDDNSTYTTQRFVQIYQIYEKKIFKGAKIYEDDLSFKTKNYNSELQTDVQIHSIFIDKKNDPQGQLGIVTQCGCFLIFRNSSNNLSREPLFVPDVNQFGSCQFLSEKKLENVHDNNSQKNKIIFSLGYDNLTLMKDALFYISDQRIDGVLAGQIMGEIVEKNEWERDGVIEKGRQWTLFKFQQYFTIRKMPLRHFIGTLLYLRSNLTNEYLGFHYNQNKFESVMQKYVKMLTPQRFLHELIALLISKEAYIAVNPFLISILEAQLNDQKSKNFKDWLHSLNQTQKKQELFISQKTKQHIWYMILDLQYKNIESGNKLASVYQTNILWKTMQNIYYQLVSPLFSFKPADFKDNTAMVQDIHDTFKFFEYFFKKKSGFERFMRNSIMTKIQKKAGQKQLDVTDASFRKDHLFQWLSEYDKRYIATKSLNSQNLLVQEKIKSAFKATSIFMSLYYNIQDYKKSSDIIPSLTKRQLPPFKDLLASRQHQNYIKKLLISNLDSSTLSEINKEVPVLNLDKDLNYIFCRNKISMEQLPIDKIDVKQLGNCINSDYFEDAQKLLKNRSDIKLKVLSHYQQKLFKDKQELIPNNTLQQRSYMNKTFFPEDEEQILKHKRTYLDRQLELTIQSQKQCISKAVNVFSEQNKDNLYKQSSIIDSIIMHISNKPYLIEHMEQRLKEKSLIWELRKLEKIKPSRGELGTQRRQFGGYINLKNQKRQLFPRKGYY